MARSKRNGREYESRREKGYRPNKWTYKVERYPNGFDRWGYPITCGIKDPVTGKECAGRVVPGLSKCAHHLAIQRRQESKGRQSSSGVAPGSTDQEVSS